MVELDKDVFQLSLFDKHSHTYTKREDTKELRQLKGEINSVAGPKLFSIENGTANEREWDIYQECMGFVSLIKYSVLSTTQIKELWDNSMLAYK